jgi:hypothetical protein
VDHPLDGVQTKLDRAEEHLMLLGSEIDAFLESKPYVVEGQFEPETHEWVERIRVKSNPPAKLGVIVGDYVHNLRSALDHLAWQLVLLDGGTPGERTQFPITSTRREFDRQAKRLGALTDRHLAGIESAQPYHAEDRLKEHPLNSLSYLSNIDKHRIVHPMFGYIRAEGVQPLRFSGPGPSPIKQILIGQKRVQEGTPVVRILFHSWADPPRSVNVGGNFAVEITFSERSISAKSMPLLREQVLATARAFYSEFE